jgi:mRNA interferase RelE/StbE
MMAAYRVEFKKSARKEFDRLPRRIQEKVVEALRFLSESPFSDLLNIKKIKGEESLYRIRIGDYRLVYEVQAVVLLVIVIKIGHRREVYRNLQ